MIRCLKTSALGVVLLSVALSGCRRVTNKVSVKDPHGAKSYQEYQDQVVYDTVPKDGDELSTKPSQVVLKDDRFLWHLAEHTSTRHRWVAQPPKGTRVFLHVKGRFVVEGQVASGKTGGSEAPQWQSLAIDIDLDADSNRNGKIDEDGKRGDNIVDEDKVEETTPGAVLCKESELVVRKIKVDLTKKPVISATGKVIVRRGDARTFDIRRKATDPTTSIFTGNNKDSINLFDEVKKKDVRLWMVPLAREGRSDVRVRMDAKIKLKGRTETVKFRDRVVVYSMGFMVKKLIVWDQAYPATVKATNPSDEHLVVCETDEGNAKIKMDIEIAPDDTNRRKRVLWKIDEETAKPNKGNFATHPVPVTLTPKDGNRTFVIKIGCDQDEDGKLDPDEIRRTMTVYVLKLKKLTVSDNADAKRTATNPTETKLLVPETAAGNAVIKLGAEFVPDNTHTKPRVLWLVEGNKAAPTKGNFVSANPTVTLTPTGGNREFVVKAGCDVNGNGTLDTGSTIEEVTHKIKVVVVRARLVSIRFTSDHSAAGKNLLRNNNTNWTDAGTAYTEPEWVTTGPTNNPISHTKNIKLTAQVVVKVEPKDLTFSLTGDGPTDGTGASAREYCDFSPAARKSTGADQQVNVTAKHAMPDRVCILNPNIAWKVTIGSLEIDLGRSGAHRIYVTYGTPSGSVVTEMRLRWSCTVCDGKTDLDDIVLKAHGHINSNTPPKFDVQTNEWPAGTPPIWKMLDATHSGGSCIAHSNLLKHIANILGIPGGTLEKVWSSTDANFDSQETHNNIGGRKCTVVVVVATTGGYEWNYYEACLKINKKYYPGAYGSKSFASKKAVHDDYASWSNRLLYLTIDAGPRRFLDRDHTQYVNPLTVPQNKCIKLP